MAGPTPLFMPLEGVGALPGIGMVPTGTAGPNIPIECMGCRHTTSKIHIDKQLKKLRFCSKYEDTF